MGRLVHRRSAAALVVALILVIGSVAGCSRSSTKTVPDSLVGVWTTPDPRYADRFLDLGRGSVTFGQGHGAQSVYAVSSVEWITDHGQSLFTIHYETEDGTDASLSFYHVPLDGTLVFRNQPQIHWFRKRS